MRFSKSPAVYLSLLYLVSAFIRLSVNFSTEFIPGANGAFYLVNIRSVIETGEIFFKDFPLVFWLEAFAARVINFFGIAGIEQSIDLASRLFDSLIPPLAIIPAYLLAKKLIDGDRENHSSVIISSLSILFISFLILVSDFQKNALGLIWIFFLLLYVKKSLQEKGLRNYLLTLFFFILTGITHFGCFSVAILYMVLLIFIKYVVRRKSIIMPFTALLFVIVISYAIISLISPPRFKTLMDFSLQIFRDPVLILFLQRQPSLSPIDFLSMFFVNAVSIAALVIYLKKENVIPECNKIFILTSIVVSIFLAFPFIGLEWSQRLNFISYVTMFPLLPFIYSSTGSLMRKKFLLAMIVVIAALSVLARTGMKTYSNMEREQFNELNVIKKKLPSEGSLLLVTRHGMEWWASYALRVSVVIEKVLIKEYWDRFDYLLFLVQKKGKAPFGPTGIHGPPFREPVIPPQSELFYSGKYYDLYRSRIKPEDMSIFNEREK